MHDSSLIVTLKHMLKS